MNDDMKLFYSNKKKIENGISHGSYQKQKLQNLNRVEQQKLRLQND